MTYTVYLFIWVFTIVEEWRNLAEYLAEFMLPHVKARGLLADVCHLVGLQGRHHLLHGDRCLLCVIPHFRQFLCTLNRHIAIH